MCSALPTRHFVNSNYVFIAYELEFSNLVLPLTQVNAETCTLLPPMMEALGVSHSESHYMFVDHLLNAETLS